MSDRERIPGDPEYFQALGLATIAFARLEWNAVYCCERLNAGYIGSIETEKKTAGRIARDLEILFGQIENKELSAKCVSMAEEFKALVDHRNALMHAHPITSPEKKQILKKGSKFWSVEEIDAFSDWCVRASSPLNALLYAELS